MRDIDIQVLVSQRKKAKAKTDRTGYEKAGMDLVACVQRARRTMMLKWRQEEGKITAPEYCRA